LYKKPSRKIHLIVIFDLECLSLAQGGEPQKPKHCNYRSKKVEKSKKGTKNISPNENYKLFFAM